ncbi:ester cyclase [Pyxidicoccus xibeiensis]|uniref:ester cyclase n=1 Tax=Pyxidicoccus xibeiensis TaxID=2906759 RepID=UPI0020A7AC40|nr:ester cyclase [Pyxidicoccus xibeiensis]MCP3143049.1 ester cyclase [Pyxidicoccus xibeiensis]
MATLDNTAVVREFYRAFNAKDLELLRSTMHPDAIVQSIPFDETEKLIDHCESWAAALPDGQVDVTHLLGQGDFVIAEFTGRGTHTGPFTGPGGVTIPASHRPIELRFIEVFELRDGKIAEVRQYYDALSLMTQLGIGARPGQSEAPAPEARH